MLARRRLIARGLGARGMALAHDAPGGGPFLAVDAPERGQHLAHVVAIDAGDGIGLMVGAPLHVGPEFGEGLGRRRRRLAERRSGKECGGKHQKQRGAAAVRQGHGKLLPEKTSPSRVERHGCGGRASGKFVFHRHPLMPVADRLEPILIDANVWAWKELNDLELQQPRSVPYRLGSSITFCPVLNL